MAERARPRIWSDGADFRYVADREHRAGLYRGDTVADCTTVHDDEPVDLVELIDGPPAGLPAVLSSVDDVARVCELAGLTRWAAQPADAVTPIWRGGDYDGVVMFQPGRVLVYHAVLRAVPVIVPMVGWPATALYAAIQAARGGEPG